MNSQGYTRRDHNQRKRRARRGNEPVLDKLLKIFFYILVALVAIILVKIIFFGNKKENSENPTTVKNEQTKDVGEADSQDTSEESGDAQSPDTSASGSESSKEEESSSEESTTPYVKQGDYSVFNNSAFVGDSRVGGMYLSSQLTAPAFYYDVGGNVSSALNTANIELDNGSLGTMVDAVKQRAFENIFIQYGVNEWGWSNSGFIDSYEKLVNEIKKACPSARIYVMSIIPVTEKFAVERANGAQNINSKLDEMNVLVQEMASRLGVNYVDVVPAITGGKRVLGEAMSSDGYHLNKTYNIKMMDYLCTVIK